MNPPYSIDPNAWTGFVGAVESADLEGALIRLHEMLNGVAEEGHIEDFIEYVALYREHVAL